MNTSQTQPGGKSNRPSISQYMHEVIQQGIFRLPTNPRKDESPNSPTDSRSISPYSEDDYYYHYELGNGGPIDQPANDITTPAQTANKSPEEVEVAEAELNVHAEMRQQIIERVLPELKWIAAQAAREEVERLIGAKLDTESRETQTETEEEKIDSMLNHFNGLSQESVQTLFTKDTMIEVLKRLVLMLELDRSEREWVDCKPR